MSFQFSRASRRGLGAGLCTLAASLPLFAQDNAPAPAAPGGNAFNPKISLILNGRYSDYSSASEADMPGFVLGPETEFAPEGFSLGETELVLEANADDKFHGWATVALENEDGETVVAVEEAYLNTLALPAGLALKFGRFFSDIGYQNRQHAHAWEFADAPLVYRAFLATQLRDDGLQLRWVAPTDLFVELGVELLRGAAFPGGGGSRRGADGQTAFAHFGGDAGDGGSWRAGLWHFRADAEDRRTGEDIPTSFTGDSRTSGADLVFKWAPGGNPAQTHLVLQAEYMVRSEQGTVVSDPDGAADSSAYDGDQRGFYVQGVYQFVPRWRAGLRYDRVGADNTLDNPVPATSLELLDDDVRDPQRWSAMVDWSNSEFSRLRLQYSDDRSRPAREKDRQIVLQYIFSLGSHPAHQY